MQKRESFYAELCEVQNQGWQPAPREYSTLTFCNSSTYLIGGQNYNTNKEIAKLSIGGVYNNSEWNNVPFHTNDDKLQGRCRHSACAYNQKIYVFGGSYMYSRKRQVRECINQIFVFDTIQRTFNYLRPKGISVQERKDHSACVYGKYMISTVLIWWILLSR